MCQLAKQGLIAMGGLLCVLIITTNTAQDIFTSFSWDCCQQIQISLWLPALHFSWNPFQHYDGAIFLSQGSSSWFVGFLKNIYIFHLEIVLALTISPSYFGQVQNSNAVLFSESRIVTAAFAYGSEIPVCRLDGEGRRKRNTVGISNVSFCFSVEKSPSGWLSGSARILIRRRTLF